MRIAWTRANRPAGLLAFAVIAVLLSARVADAADEPGEGAASGIAERQMTSPPARGVRRIAGRYLTLVTDLPPGGAVDALPDVFDRAVPQWCDYFGVRPAKAIGWRPRAFLMGRRQTFQASGLLPDDLPDFAHGFSRGQQLWLDEQPTDYYRRHLLLHEGTHSFMNSLLGGCGPTWYMEGIAELLATHAYRGGELRLGYFPTRREEVPMLARIQLVQQAVAEGRGVALSTIMAYPPRGARADNEFYAWCWAAAAFFDGHARYRDRFHHMAQQVQRSDFNRTFRQLLADDWPHVVIEWRLFTNGLEYGHDRARTAVEFRAGRPVGHDGAVTTIAADRGWQSTGWRVEAGRPYAVTARGRYQIVRKPKVWWCEPGGVTIHYYRARPLGMVLGTVIPDDPIDRGPAGQIAPLAIGLKADLVPEVTGTLYVKINESSGALGDNAGTFEVALRPK